MSNPTKLPPTKFKLVVLGDSGVGKSCMLRRYIDGKFPEGKCVSTMGIDRIRQDVMLGNNKQINVEIFDTAGQERFRTITTAYYKTSRAFLLVFDVGARDSFDHVKVWIDQIERFSHRKHVRFLIGNKIDSDRKISYDEAMDYARENDCKYFEISAKTGKNIDELFKKVMDDLYETGKKKKDKKNKKSTKKDDGEPGGCCVVQ